MMHSEKRKTNPLHRVMFHVPLKGNISAPPGPKEDTVADFWRMIWEQKVSTVVMLTNVKERKEVSGRRSVRGFCVHLKKLHNRKQFSFKDLEKKYFYK